MVPREDENGRENHQHEVPGDYGYIAYYKGIMYGVYAKTSYAAQKAVAAAAKAKRESDVNVMVAENPDGSPIIHTPDM